MAYQGSRPAGWYTLPGVGDKQAYWDGAQWTGTTRAGARPRPGRRWLAVARFVVFTLLTTIALLGILLISGVLHRV